MELRLFTQGCRRRSLSRPFGAALLSAALAAGLLAAPARAQSPGPLKGTPDADRRTSPSLSPSLRGTGVPREIGEIIETTEAARQSGITSLRYVRRVAGAIYDWANHLRISVVENDVPGIAYDRENCELLYELMRETNPSVLLSNDLGGLREQVLAKDGDPTQAFLRLQLDIEKFRFLYPLLDLDGMTRTILQQQRDGRQSACVATIDAMTAAVALPNLDGPISRSEAAFRAGLSSLDTGERRVARQYLKQAANYITQVSVGTYLAECSWFLAKSDNALRSGLGAIALASIRSADTCLKDAEDRSWRDFKPRVSAVHDESGRLVDDLTDRTKKGTLSTANIRSLAKRVDSELRIPE